MSNQYLRAFAVRAGGKRGGPIPFLARAANGKARDDIVLDHAVLDLSAYQRNAVLLFGHDYTNRPPIGRVDNLSKTDASLTGDAVFDSENDEFARSIESKYRNGFMSAFSIGWRTIEVQGAKVTRSELLDIRAVNVGSDPLALVEAQRLYRSLATQPPDFSQLANLSEDDQKAFLRALHHEIVVKPRVEGILREAFATWRA